jgi:rhamnogalacturonyl hydrolase YesR
VISSLAVLLAASVAPAAVEPTVNEVRSIVRLAARDHLAHPSGVDLSHWVIAPFYDGLLRAGFATGDDALVAGVLDFGRQAGWTPGYRFYHADDVAVGHAWLDLYRLDPARKERLLPIQARLDQIIAQPVTEELNDFTAKPRTPGVEVTDRWTWCDALYMSPPTLARLYALTGDGKYLRFMDSEYRFCYDRLYDPAEKLFYRDSRFVGPQGKKSPHGKKVFWSRGNGWVYGGLVLILEHLPADHPSRPFYAQLFREMTTAILAAQQADGFWYPNLSDPAEIAQGEASGTGFFVFGLAWGVNQGVLDRSTHWPAVLNGWRALVSALRPDGLVGRVQQIGFAPDKFGPQSIEDYGTGAFLLAGAEVLRGLGGATDRAPADVYAAAEARIAARLIAPQAYARHVPERKDDLAWENDKVAFRVYGPALRAGPEDSGIDAWTKRVPFPVLDKWYRRDLTEGVSYHQDHGEGLDGYHVGNTRGCGGIGLWIDGQLVTADTLVAGKIHWTKPDVAEFSTIYEYPVKHQGQPVYEHRLTRLRLGERLMEVEIFFASGKSRAPRPLAGFDPEIALGLVTQGAEAKLILDAVPRGIAVYEPFAGGSLGTGLLVAGQQPVRALALPATDPKGPNRHALLVTRLEADHKLRYRAGFAWSMDGEITTEAVWLEYLRGRR